MTESHEPGSLLQLLENSARDTPFLPAYTFLDSRLKPVRVVSCIELWSDCVRLAGAFQARFGKGEPVILFYAHGAEFLRAFFACSLAGCVPVPLSYSRRRDLDKLRLLVEASGIRSVASPRTIAGSVSGTGPGDSAAGMTLLETDHCADADQWHKPDVEKSDIAVILMTEGDHTGSKGVALSHDAVLSALSRMKQSMSLGPQERMLSISSCVQGAGLMMNVLLPMYLSAPAFLLDPENVMVRPVLWLEAVSRYRCSFSGGTGYSYGVAADLLDESVLTDLDLSCWKLACVGSARTDGRKLRRFARKFGPAKFSSKSFFHYYGLAEFGYFVCGRFGLQASAGASIPALSAGGIPEQIGWMLKPSGLSTAEGSEQQLMLCAPSSGLVAFRSAVPASRDLRVYLDALVAAAKAGVLHEVATADLVCLADGELYIRGKADNVIPQTDPVSLAEDIEALVINVFCCRGVNRCVSVYLEDTKELVVALECSVNQFAEQWRGAVARIKTLVGELSGLMPDRVLLLRPNSLPATSSGKISRQECKALFRSGELMTRLLPVRGRGDV